MASRKDIAVLGDLKFPQIEPLYWLDMWQFPQISSTYEGSILRRIPQFLDEEFDRSPVEP